MALTLPVKFASDIRGRDTALIPVVVIGDFDTTDIVYDDEAHSASQAWMEWLGTSHIISTNSFVINGVSAWFTADVSVKPILLNIPSLKETINISTRKYSISSINLDISNYEYEGKRFSEIISEQYGSLINTECRVYWFSPTTKSPNPFYREGIYQDGDAFQVYTGTVRRYEHDDEKVKLVIEDKSQAALHKDLPLDNLGDSAMDKYKNAYVPMAYGYIDKSPCVIASAPLLENEALLEGEIDIIPDISDEISLIGNNPLYVAKEGTYINIPGIIQELQFQSGAEYAAVVQYIRSGKSILLQSSYEYSSGSENIGSNPISNNEIIGFETLTPTSIIPLRVESGKALHHSSGQMYYATVSDHTFSGFPFTIRGTLFRENDADDWGQTSKIFDGIGEGTDIWWNIISGSFEETLVGCTMEIPIISESSYKDDTGYIRANFGMNYYDKEQFTAATGVTIKYRFGGNSWGDYESEQWGSQGAAGTETNPIWVPAAQPTYNSLTGVSTPIRIDQNVGQLLFYMQIEAGVAVMAGQTIFEGVEVDHWMLMDNLFKMDFYANVKGRGWGFWYDGYNRSPNAMKAIIHLLRNELGVDRDLLPLEDELPDGYGYWQYAFTVDKKINSKKLIEGIASASSFIPHFNNMGDFKFDIIKKSYEDGDLANAGGNETIKEADVISYSSNRTKIEDVKTKVEFFYNWDYARKEFNSSIIKQVDDSWEGFDYYGLNNDHGESTLLIDDDRGKYIRHFTWWDPDSTEYENSTAGYFAEWILLWSLNQHLIMKIKLPLKYMNLEIGDVIEFDKVLGDVKPYGIDYTNSGFLNEQTLFPFFMITNTNKTLEFCELECIQMHDLDIPVYAGETITLQGNYELNTVTATEVAHGYHVVGADLLTGGGEPNLLTTIPDLVAFYRADDSSSVTMDQNGTWGAIDTTTGTNEPFQIIAGQVYYVYLASGASDVVTDLFYWTP